MFGTDLQTELWTDPLIMIVGPPGVFILVFYSLLLFPHHICVTITNFFFLSEMDGGKIQKIQDFGHFWLFFFFGYFFGGVLWGPHGVP